MKLINGPGKTIDCVICLLSDCYHWITQSRRSAYQLKQVARWILHTLHTTNVTVLSPSLARSLRMFIFEVAWMKQMIHQTSCTMRSTRRPGHLLRPFISFSLSLSLFVFRSLCLACFSPLQLVRCRDHWRDSCYHRKDTDWANVSVDSFRITMSRIACVCVCAWKIGAIIHETSKVKMSFVGREEKSEKEKKNQTNI